MDVSNKYCIYFGTVRGAIGSTYCKLKEQAKYELFEECEGSGITCMEWGRTQDEIILGQNNGALSLYNTSASRISSISEIGGTGSIVGAAVIEENIFAAQKSGCAVIWNDDRKDCFTLNLSGDSTVECIAHNMSRVNVIACGGQENDLKLWDIKTKKPIFKAKSIGHDNLNLPIPTTIRGISFLDKEGNLPSCCTKEGYVLLYDERAQRKPVCKFAESKASFTTIASACKEQQCLVGTTKGYMQLLDMRHPVKCLKTFRTFTGSVSSIVCDPVASTVVTVSLDRYLRIHDIESRELVYKEYLKQCLTKVILKPIVKEDKDDDEEDGKNAHISPEQDEEYEKIFKEMEKVNEQKKRMDKIKRKKGMVKNIFASELVKNKKKKIK